MSETLEISKENAVKAFEEANDKGKALLSNLFGKKVFQKKITDRVKTFLDVLSEAGETLGQFQKRTAGLSIDAIAYEQVKLLVKVLNEGWVPDWNNSSQYKYTPYFDMRSEAGFGFSYAGYDYWHTRTSVGSRLCFKSSELAKYAGEQFTDIYKELLT